MHAAFDNSEKVYVLALHRRRMEELEWFYNFLDQETNDYERISSADFSGIIQKSINLGVEQNELCDEFSVNKSTIHRWITDKSSPQPLIRPLVISWLKKRVGSLAEEMKMNPIVCKSQKFS